MVLVPHTGKDTLGELGVGLTEKIVSGFSLASIDTYVHALAC